MLSEHVMILLKWVMNYVKQDSLPCPTEACISNINFPHSLPGTYWSLHCCCLFNLRLVTLCPWNGNFCLPGTFSNINFPHNLPGTYWSLHCCLFNLRLVTLCPWNDNFCLPGIFSNIIFHAVGQALFPTSISRFPCTSPGTFSNISYTLSTRKQ